MESIKKNKSEIFFYIFTAQKRDYDFLSEHESIAVDGATVWLLSEEY